MKWVLIYMLFTDYGVTTRSVMFNDEQACMIAKSHIEQWTRWGLKAEAFCSPLITYGVVG